MIHNKFQQTDFRLFIYLRRKRIFMLVSINKSIHEHCDLANAEAQYAAKSKGRYVSDDDATRLNQQYSYDFSIHFYHL